MDNLTTRPWWRWQTGMVVRVEGWGGRPVPCGVVVGSGEMARVADEWGTTPRIMELQAMACVRVVPDLDSPATVGCLLERLSAAVCSTWTHGAVVVSIQKTEAILLFGDRAGTFASVRHNGATLAAALIAALDDVTGVAP